MSTYNKKLPKPSEITWMDAKRGNRSRQIIMPYGGMIPSGVCYLGWRQNSYSYSYQVMYCITARLSPDKQLQTGSETTKTGWKYPNPDWSGNIDTMNRGVKMDKKNRYYRYYSFAGKSLMTKGTYDRMKLTVMVRSFNASKKQHGPWATETLTIKCRPTVKVYKIIALADGGLQIYLNTNGWKRGDSKVILGDIRKQGESAACNKKKLTDEVGAIGGEEAKDYPYAEFDGTGFRGAFAPGDKVVLKDCVFRTCDGVDASIDGIYTIDPVSAVIDPPTIRIERDEGGASMTVHISKSDAADDWDTVSAWLSCKIHGAYERINYVEATGTDDAKRTYKFRPPLDSTIRMSIQIKNNLKGEFRKTYTVDDLEGLKEFASNGRLIVNYTDGTDKQPMNGMFNGSQVATMNYDMDYSTDAKRPYEKELPFGRGKPVAFLGEGIEKTINVKGSIDGTETGEFQSEAYSGYHDWEKFQEQQGIVLLRLPHGRTFHALCTKVLLEQTDEYDESREVTIALEEVDV